MSRLDRVKALLQQEISSIIQSKVQDSKVGFISIIDMEISPDLSHARVYFSTFGADSDGKRSERALAKCSNFIQYELGKVIRLKQIPSLRFIYDESLKRGSEIVSKMGPIKNA